jgi:hypothetical protein
MSTRDQGEAPATTEDRLDRLVRALERLVTVEERKLAASNSQSRRAAKQAGPTTDGAMAIVQKRLRKVRGR